MTDTTNAGTAAENEELAVDRESIKKRAKHKLVVFVISLLFVVIVCTVVYEAVDFALFKPASLLDSSNVEVTIKSNSSVSTIAKTLHEHGLIRNPTVFKLMVDFYNQGSNLKAGDYVFKRTMTPREIMYKLAAGESKPRVVRFTTIEGYTVEEEAESLKKDKFIATTDVFLSLAKTGEDFMAYDFISEIPQESAVKRRYRLEGYLFPDTYEIFLGASEKTIMAKQIAQFNKVFSDKYRVRAEQMGMTIDQVVILASVIQKEANPSEFKKVSAVLHNRLKKGMPLQSCASVQYAKGVKRMNLTAEDLAFDSPYNTYKYAGYPAGPICNPSEQAIEDALYPDESFLAQNYLYFCNKDPDDGELAFSKTLEEHEQNVEKYRPLWIDFDKEHGY
ncbi:MAG: endolytic transglycosylase MltG [Clostridiales bacterium]|jgi:UPF0755 protein|nr:endolytic transglycosylase MltG [Clostridiales bacterium]